MTQDALQNLFQSLAASNLELLKILKSIELGQPAQAQAGKVILATKIANDAFLSTLSKVEKEKHQAAENTLITWGYLKSVDGTSIQGELYCSYKKLKETFGVPDLICDGYKTDAEGVYF